MATNVNELLSNLTAEQIANLLALANKMQQTADPIQQAVRETAKTPRRAAADFVGDEEMASSLREIPAEVWALASVTDRVLSHVELVALETLGASEPNGPTDRVGADLLRRMGEDGVIAHPANTVRVRWVRADREHVENQEALLALYSTNADGVDCDKATLMTLSQFEEVFAMRDLLTEPIYAEQYIWGLAQPGQTVDTVTGEIMPWQSIRTLRTFVYRMTLGSVDQNWRFFVPKDVASVIITRFKSSPESRLWNQMMQAQYRETGTVSMIDLARFDAASRIVRLTSSDFFGSQIARGQFNFASIRSNERRTKAVNIAANALNLSSARTDVNGQALRDAEGQVILMPFAEKQMLAQRLLNSSAALMAYRRTSDARNAARRQNEDTSSAGFSNATSAGFSDTPAIDELPF